MLRRLLCLAMLCFFIPTAAALGAETSFGEKITVQPSYEGEWSVFKDFQFGLMLPKTWTSVKAEKEIYFMAVDETAEKALWIELYQSEGHTLDSVLKDLKALPGFDGVEGMYYNGVPFVRYTVPKEDLFGFATLTADGNTLLFFKFTPASDAKLIDLSTQIMSTLSPLPTP